MNENDLLNRSQLKKRSIWILTKNPTFSRYFLFNVSWATMYVGALNLLRHLLLSR